MKRLWILILILSGVIPAVLAQDLPAGVYQAAVRAANAVQPTLGEPSGFQFELLSATSLSSLGCPLVQGVEMTRSVTPYRISLTYPAGQYVIYVSTDGSLTQLCDSKFGTITAATPAPPSGCELAAAAEPAVRLAPDESAAVMDSGGVLTDGKTYAIGRSVQKNWYQVRTLNKAVGWIDAALVTASGNCDSVPITALPNTDFDGNTCFVTPASGFSNIRQRPSTENQVVGQMVEGSYWQVFVRNTAGDWYYINPGWVNLRVVQTYGICEGLETNDELVGLGMNFLEPVSVTPVAGATIPAAITPVAVNPSQLSTPLPAQFVCPTGLAGYLPPRLTRGAANARITAGDEPNRLRSEPSVSAAQVGLAQPERTLDAIIDGPACSGTFVWWLVEIDDVRGWTAESDASTNTYFIEPLGVTIGSTATPGGSVSTSPANPTASGDGTAALAALMLQNPVDAQQVVFSLDGKYIAAWGQDEPFVHVWDVSNLSAITPPIALPPEADPITTEIAASPANQLAVLTDDNVLHIYEFGTYILIATVFDVDKESTLAFNQDGTLLLTVTCNNPDCTQGRIDLRDADNGSILRSQPAHTSRPGGAVFSPDGTRIASWGDDGIQIWDTQSGAFVSGITKNPADAAVSNVVFSADSTQVLQAVCQQSGGVDACTSGDVIFYDAATGAETSRMAAAETGAVARIALSPDGLFLATATTSRVRLWDVMTKAQTLELNGSSTIAFSPDGRLFVTKAGDVGSLGIYTVPVANSAG